MPGNPLFRKFEQAVDALGGEQYMLEQVIDGKKHAEIAAQFGVSRWMVLRYFLNQGEERAKRYREAQALLAIGLVDDADTLLENASEFESASVQKAKHRADLKRWLASRLNPAQFGDKVEVSHTLGFSEQLLAVLKQRGRPREVADAEFEVLPAVAPILPAIEPVLPAIEAVRHGGMAGAYDKMADDAADMAHLGHARDTIAQNAIPQLQEVAVPTLDDLLGPA